jgi:protein-tyrosine phosphatase
MAQKYGAITVTLVSETKQPILNMNEKRGRTNGPGDESITIRRFLIQHDGYPPHIVTQLQYTGWTDFGVPDHPIGILQVIYEADEVQSSSFSINETKGPMVIHCSAGCGRTGTFCVIDTVIQRLCQERDVCTSCSVDKIYETVKRFREQRMSMVQTHRQYVFCYEAIIWWMLGYGHLPTSTPLKEIAPEATDGTALFLSNEESGSDGSVGSMLSFF